MPQGSVIGNHHEIELVRPDVRASSLFRSGEPRPVRSLDVLPCSQACRLEREMACFDYGECVAVGAGLLSPQLQWITHRWFGVDHMEIAIAVCFAVVPGSSVRWLSARLPASGDDSNNRSVSIGFRVGRTLTP